MKRSLSVVLPVRNAERTLRDNLQHIFDVLADLTDRFEVLLVDDGSTDQTLEIAYELSIIYPQLRVVARSGRSISAIDADWHLARATGDVVLFQQSHAPFSPSAVRRIWKSCDAKLCAGPARRYDAGNDDGFEGGAPRPLGLCAPRPVEVNCLQMIRSPGQRSTRGR